MKNVTHAGFLAAQFADSITHAKMTKVLVLFAEDGAGLGDRVSTQLKATGFDVSHGDVLDDISALTATVVVWTPGAAANENICAIARHEKAERRLVPVAITSRDAPSGFEDLPPIQLQGWTGDANDPRWRFVLDEVGLASGDKNVVDHLKQPPAKKYTPYALRSTSVTPLQEDGPVATRSPIYPPRRESVGLSKAVKTLLGGLATLPRRLREPQVALPAFAGVLLFVGVASFGLGLGRGKGAEVQFAAAEGQVAPTVTTADTPASATDRTYSEDNSSLPSVSFVQPLETPQIEPETPMRAAQPEPEEATGPTIEATLSATEADQTGLEFTTLPQPVTEAMGDDIYTQSSTDDAVTTPASPSLATASRPMTVSSPSAGETSFGDDRKAEGAMLDEDVDDPIAKLAWNATTAADAQNAEAEFIGNYFKECLDCPSMAVIAPDPADESTAEFAISVRPVSGAEWRACVADGVCAGGRPQGDSPVSATYGDVLAYTAWLSSKTGGEYRAPSAAEWAMSSASYYGVEGMRGLNGEWWITSPTSGSNSSSAGAARRPFRVVRILY